MDNKNICMQNCTKLRQKQLGAIFLLSGTAIGSGMISLPIVLAKFGIINTILIMLVFASLTYITALIRADLNLCVPNSVSLTDIGNAFSCKYVGICGDFMLIVLHFALMAAYISGGASVINSFCGNSINQQIIILIFSFAIFTIFFFALKLVVCVNKILFISMFSALIILVILLFFQTPISFVPTQSSYITTKEWTTLVPVIFTSFGFQGAIHSMTKFCNGNSMIIKRACFWGSFIPAIVYIVWTTTILLVISNTDVNFFKLMLNRQTITVGDLIKALSIATSEKCIQIIVWTVSVLALLTSILGVGLSLLDLDFFKSAKQKFNFISKKTISIILAVFGPAMISIFAPGLFIKILNVAGIILAIIAIICPTIIYILKPKINSVLNVNRLICAFAFIFGSIIILLGICDFCN